MKTIFTVLLLTIISLTNAQDKVVTQHGDLELFFVGHGSLYINYEGTIIHIDPWSRVGDYAKLPDADLILITHDHGDHLDINAISKIVKSDTKIIAPKICEDALMDYQNVTIMTNGTTYIAKWGKVSAVPAYNIVHKREGGKPYHPQGVGNGYVLSIDGKRVYIAGDTENIPEMKNLKYIDVAFIPMNLPYTMTPQMAANAALMVKPKILYPYHFGDTNTDLIVDLLKDSGIEVRIRDMK